jgi:hypothetical protein
MLKLYGLLQRRPDLSLEQFSRHWRTVHRELALRLVAPGIMRGYVQNHRRELDVAGQPAPADGCPEVWIDDLESLARLATSPEYLEGAGPDEPNFIDGGSANCIGQPRFSHGVARPGAGEWKVMMFYAHAVEDESSWSHAGPWSMPAARPLRLERDRCLTDVPGVLPYTAVEATWWRDLAAFQSAWQRASTAPSAIAPAALLPIAELVVLWPDERNAR